MNLKLVTQSGAPWVEPAPQKKTRPKNTDSFHKGFRVVGHKPGAVEEAEVDLEGLRELWRGCGSSGGFILLAMSHQYGIVMPGCASQRRSRSAASPTKSTKLRLIARSLPRKPDGSASRSLKSSGVNDAEFKKP